MLDITTLAAWGEFIGGIAVVVSLLYLASQIRHNSSLLRASTASAQSQISFQQTALIAQDPELRRFDPLLAGVMETNRQALRFARDGLTSAEVWEDQEKGMRWMAQQPGVRQWWTQWRSNFGGDYVGVFDRMIDEAQAAE